MTPRDEQGTEMTTIARTLAHPGRLAPLVTAVLLALSGAVAPAAAQDAAPEIVGTGMTVSSGSAELELETAGGETHRISLRDGQVTVDGEAVGSYEPGGAFERSWRELLASGLQGSPGFHLDAERLRTWEPAGGGAPSGTVEALTSALDRVLGAPAPEADTSAGEAAVAVQEAPGGGQVSLAPGRLSFDRLTRQLQRLERSLGRLGEEASGAADDLALVVHEDYELPRGRTVDGNLALLDGELRLGGRVTGDVLVLDGTLVLEPAARVEGDVLQVGGEVQRRGGQVGGEFLSIEAAAAAPEAAAPEIDVEARIDEEVRDRLREAGDRHRPGFFGRIGRNVGNAVGGVLGVLGLFLMLGLAGVLAVYFLQPQIEVVADTARHSFGRSFGVGLAGQFLFFPVLLVLVVAVVTWLVIPFYVAASAVGVLAGYLAVAHSVGELLARRRFQYAWIERIRRSNSYYYVLSGLAVLLVPFALAEAFHVFGWWLGFLRGLIWFVAVVATWVAASAGLGAVLLSRGGQRSEYAEPGPSAPGSTGAATP